MTLVTQEHTILREKCLPIDGSSPEADSLFTSLAAVLDEHKNGVGLSAPQIGIASCAFIMRAQFAPGYVCGTEIKHENHPLALDPGIKYLGFGNPSFEPLGKTTECDIEGCLSLPGVTGYVERARKILSNALMFEIWDDKHISFLGEFRGLVIKDLSARIFQHETDHLSGILITDRFAKK